MSKEKKVSPFPVIQEFEKQWKDNYNATIIALSKDLISKLSILNKEIKKEK